MVKHALVVKREDLFDGEKAFEGFKRAEEKDYLGIIAKKYFYHPRGDALENDESLLQIIPYVWFVNPEKRMVFL